MFVDYTQALEPSRVLDPVVVNQNQPIRQPERQTEPVHQSVGMYGDSCVIDGQNAYKNFQTITHVDKATLFNHELGKSRHGSNPYTYERLEACKANILKSKGSSEKDEPVVKREINLYC